ncbi:MAG: hypothetical protein R3F21_20490 [Myxococcota bacterium]
MSTPYEVRCPRCDVSFPVETRRCIHCGGPTSAAGATAPVVVDTKDMPPWIRSSEEAGRSPGAYDDAGSGGGGSVPRIGDEDRAEVPEEAPSSLASTLLRTFGSLFWVIALVAFSILRNCGEG